MQPETAIKNFKQQVALFEHYWWLVCGIKRRMPIIPAWDRFCRTFQKEKNMMRFQALHQDHDGAYGKK